MLFLASLALAAGMASGEASVRLSQTDAAGKWGATLQTTAEKALAQAEAGLGFKLDRTVEILSLPNSLDFERYLEASLPRVVAVARPQACQVVINRRAFFNEEPAARQQVLVHEMTHLLVGRAIKGRIPAWLDEGLAMLVAGENNIESNWRVLVAGTFDTLIPVQMLMDRVAIGEGNQDQAYAQSLSLTRFYIHQQFPDQQGFNPAPLVRLLADPDTGPRRVKLLWDPIVIASLEYQWRHSWQIIWSMIIFLSGSGFMWMAISLLFLLAWWRKRRMARAIRERFGDEEDWDAEFGEAPPTWQEPDPADPPWRP